MSISVSNLDHLGLVAGIIDEIGIVDKINELLGEHKCEKISAGQVVKGMLLNGLGLVSSPLYLFSRFFEGKATEHLLGEGIKAEYLNDDRLGRVLDALHEKGLNQIFVSLALAVVKKYQIKVETVHLDSSSFSVQGDYKSEPEKSEEEPTQAINITYGYSRDHRPDLKQFMMDLICSSDGDIPLWMRIGSGNETDKQQFGLIMQEYKRQMEWDSLMVLDSGFYSQENLQMSQNLAWVSRVPLTIKAAVALVQEITEAELIPSSLTGYSYKEVKKTYGGVEQRWLLVQSEKRREADLRKLEKKIQKEKTALEKKLRQLSDETFACIVDAKKAAKKLFKKAKYHQLSEVQVEKVSASKASEETPEEYQVQGFLNLSEEKVQPHTIAAGRFILATNVLEPEKLSSEGILLKYKGQQSVERGFRFLKDPMFLTDSIFVKSPRRVETLGFIMGLCLLVYSLGQRLLRGNLQRRQVKVPNQNGRPTERPTLRWIFQCFQSIHLVFSGQQREVSNLTSERLFLLQFFPAACQRYYLLA